MYGGEPLNATHLHLTHARIDEEFVRARRRAVRMEAIKRVLAIVLMVIAMSPFGIAAALYLMGH